VDVESGELELLDTTGKLLRIAWDQVKWVCFVRELSPGDSSGQNLAARTSGSDQTHPERLLRRRFSSRPRGAGIWLRITLSDGDELEGLASNDRTLVDGPGLFLIPPDTRSNTQRVLVPRSSIRELTVLGVINPSRIRGEVHRLQPELFERAQNEQES
jgi:uncharacterized protein DUF6982